MNLPKNYLATLQLQRYRDYIKLLPQRQKENAKIILMLIFTFFALSFFGFFAINPTIKTIIELQKQIDDSEEVLDQLKTKMNNLSQLQQQYTTTIPSDLPFIYAAIPEQPQASYFVGQVQSLTKKHNLTIVGLTIPEVVLQTEKATASSSFVLDMKVKGSYDNIMAFLSSLNTMNRIVTIESLSLSKDITSENLILQVQGKEYNKL